MAISSELEQLLAGWIPRQPWFPKLAADFGMDPDITPMSVARAFTYTAEELGGFSGLVTVISVGDGPTLRRLNIPLSLRGAEDIHLRHALIGTVEDLALGRVFVYDGAADPIFVNLLADAITQRKVFDGGQLSTESLRHSRERGTLPASAAPAARVPQTASATVPAGDRNTGAEAVPPKPSAAPSLGEAAPPLSEVRGDIDIEIRPIEVSDSGANKSTVVIHDEYEPVELSFFRVLENGMPSSLTIPVLLTEAGSRSVPEVLGWSSGRWYDMFEVTEMEAPMALLSRTDVEAEPAWREAVDIVCSVDSGSIGGYNAQAAEMGRRIGELHSDMAAEFGIVEGRGAPTKEFVDKWTERVDWALGRAPLALDALAPELKRHKAKLRSLDTIGQLQKIHGELTLDHVVSSPSEGYQVVKFTDSSNSEPKPVALDLVALLRSVDYAAGFARLQRTQSLEQEDGGLDVNGFGDKPAALRAIYDSPEYLWASQVQNSLLSGYSRARGESVALGDGVLRAALIDRLLVEVVTELRNRPNWLSVPLATLTLILKGKPARGGDDPAEAAPGGTADAEEAAGAGMSAVTEGAAVAEESAVAEDTPVNEEAAGLANDASSAVDAGTADDAGAPDDAGAADDADEIGSSESDPVTADRASVGEDSPAGDTVDDSDPTVGDADLGEAADDGSGSSAAWVAGAAGVVGTAGIAGVAAGGVSDAEHGTAVDSDSDTAVDSERDTAVDADRDTASDPESDGVPDAPAHASETTGTGESADTDEVADTDDASVADGTGESADTEGEETDHPVLDSQITMVDAVTAEQVEPQQDEIPEMRAAGPALLEPSVEAPTDAPLGSDATPSQPSAEAAPGDERETTSARGTTVTRTQFIGLTTSGSGTDAASANDDSGGRVSGGANVEDTYVDAVTAEEVGRVDDDLTEADHGVHDSVESDVEAGHESDAPGDTDSVNDPEAVDADPEAVDVDHEAVDADHEAVAGDAPPIVDEEHASGVPVMPDAPPMPSEPPEARFEPLPDAPTLGDETGESAVGSDAEAPAVEPEAAEDEDDFGDDEEAEFVPSRVPATFAARGATTEDADSTGRSPLERHKHEADGPVDESQKKHGKKNGKRKH